MPNDTCGMIYHIIQLVNDSNDLQKPRWEESCGEELSFSRQRCKKFSGGQEDGRHHVEEYTIVKLHSELRHLGFVVPRSGMWCWVML